MSSVQLTPPAPRTTSARRITALLALLLLTLVVVGAVTAGWSGAVLALGLGGGAASTWLCLYTSSGIGG